MKHINVLLTKREVTALRDYWETQRACYEALSMRADLQLAQMKLALYNATLGRMP